MEVTTEVKIDAPEEKTLFGHPVGLFYLFFAELWERFSYYGMRALLVLYIVDEYFQNIDEAGREIKAFGIFGAYGALVYATPLLGGMIADRFIGYRKSIILGGILMAVGHFCMAIETPIFFYLALGLLVVGNGFFKPNISAMVGTLYKENDPRRDGGFTIFYMGVNVGAMLSPLVCGWLGEKYGWHFGFGAAGVGMLVGLIVFWKGLKDNVLGDRGFQPKHMEDKKWLGIPVDKAFYVIGFIVVPFFSFLIYKNDMHIMGSELMSGIQSIILVIVLCVLTYFGYQMNKVERERMAVIVILTFFIMVFWSFFEQSGSSLTLFAKKNVNLEFMTASQTQSINPFYIMLLAVPFSLMWTKLSFIKKNPSTPFKFSLGIFQLGLGFLTFAVSAKFMDADGRVPLMFLLAGYLLMTTGELFVSPIGLSKVTELAPAKIVAFMLGVYYLSSSFAHHIAGQIAKLTVGGGDASGETGGFMNNMITMITGFTDGRTDSTLDGIQNLAIYSSVFAQIGIISIGVAIIVGVLSPVIRKLMHGIH